MGRKKDTLQQRSAKKTMRRRFRYDDEKPFIELLKPEYQHQLIVGDIAKELKSLLHDGDKIDIRTMTYLDFRIIKEEPDGRPCCSRNLIYMWLARLLNKTGGKGTRYRENMIFRYITNGHSNLNVKETYLKTAVYKWKKAN
jgi:hypothetical protein